MDYVRTSEKRKEGGREGKDEKDIKINANEEREGDGK